MIISISEYSRLVMIIECDPAAQGRDDLTVSCYFKNQHVNEFTCSSETHTVRIMLIFKLNVISRNL